MNITVWNEYHQTAKEGKAQKIYPNGIHGTIKEYFKDIPDVKVYTAIQEEPENGLTDKVLDNTDVLIWWGQNWHANVLDSVVEKVCKRVLAGMGIIFLHGAHSSKPFKKLMGTTGALKWRETETKERIWTMCPAHQIANGIPESFTLEAEEMYGELFDIPNPDDVVFMSWFPTGEIFRSGCTFLRGLGKIFFFQPGHETYPSYHNEYVKKIIINAALWAKPYVTSKTLIPEPVATVEQKKGFFKRK